MPEPASTMNIRRPQQTSMQGVLPPNSAYCGPLTGVEPRTPQKRRTRSWSAAGRIGSELLDMAITNLRTDGFDPLWSNPRRRSGKGDVNTAGRRDRSTAHALPYHELV